MNALIITTTILVSITSFLLFRKACGSMSLLKLNTISYVFYFQIITSALLGSVFVALKLVDYHPDLQYVSDEVKLESWMWVLYSVLMIPIGMLILNHFFESNIKEKFNQYLKQDIALTGDKQYYGFVIFLLIFSVFILYYIFSFTEKIALYTLLVEGDSEQAAIDRVSARRDFQGIDHIKNLLGNIMIPVITYYIYILLRKFKSPFYFVSFIISFLISAFLLIYDIQKAPIAFFILGFWILEVFISKGLTIKKTVFFFLIPVVLILLGYNLTTDKSILSQIVNVDSAFYSRIFLVGYFSFPLSLELFPDVISEPTYAIGLPHALIENVGINSTESARLLKTYVHYQQVQEGTGNLYSGYFMAEAWANYGYFGLISAPIIVGIVIQSVHLFLLRSIKEPLILAFYAYVTVKWLLGAGFVNFLYLKIIFWPLILYYTFRFIERKFFK